MIDEFRIAYNIDRVECDKSPNEVETFVEHVLRGSVTIYSGDRSIRIWPCGLLRVSRSLIRLCTFPALYRVEAQESILDEPIDFRSVYTDGNIVLEVGRIGQDHEKITISLPVSDALEIVGDFHKNILLELFRRCQNTLNENLLLQIPDAFPLSFLARTGRIALNLE
jgi:hypothetical protein